MTEDQFLHVRDLIEHRAGIHLDDKTKASLQASVRARMDQLGIRGFDDYGDRLARDVSEEEFRRLLNLVTVNETAFFRDPAHFRLLRTRILPTLIAARQAEKARALRIWSAGCSTGAETYSIAMVLLEMGVYAACPDWTVEIIGTDVNTDVLDAARRGVYTARSIRNVESEWLRRYFEADGDVYRVKDEVKRGVQFLQGNLVAEPFPPPNLLGQDVIFCKNVTIYFRREVTRRLMRGFFGALRDGGYLFLGHSESLWQISDQFRLMEHDGVFCYRKGSRERSVDAWRDVAVGSHVRVRPAADVEVRRPSSRKARTVTAPPPEPVSPGPADGIAGYDECLARFRSGAWDETEATLRTLLHANPEFIRGHLLLSALHAHRGRYGDALAEAECALQLNALEGKAHLLVGMIEARRGRTDRAVDAFRRALFLDDSLVLAHLWLGNLYRERGDWERAAREYRNVIRAHQRHAVELPEEFGAELTVEQLVDACRRTLQLLRHGGRSPR